MALKKYNKNMEETKPPQGEPLKSGVACDEPKCKGEMMILQPTEHHPEINGLKRALCGKCNWRGWV